MSHPLTPPQGLQGPALHGPLPWVPAPLRPRELQVSVARSLGARGSRGHRESGAAQRCWRRMSLGWGGDPRPALLTASAAPGAWRRRLPSPRHSLPVRSAGRGPSEGPVRHGTHEKARRGRGRPAAKGAAASRHAKPWGAPRLPARPPTLVSAPSAGEAQAGLHIPASHEQSHQSDGRRWSPGPRAHAPSPEALSVSGKRGPEPSLGKPRPAARLVLGAISHVYVTCPELSCE